MRRFAASAPDGRDTAGSGRHSCPNRRITREDSKAVAREWTVLARGFGVLEAPAVADDGVYFSDVTGGGVYRVGQSGTPPEVVIPKRKGVGGLALHRAGGIVITGRDVRQVGAGDDRVLLESSDVCSPEGTVTSFNDFSVGPDGELYIGTVQTPIGRQRADDELVSSGDLIVVRQPGVVNVIATGIGSANGCAYSTSHLYQVDSANRKVVRVDHSTGRVDSYSTTAIDGIPDGVALDAESNLWIAFYGGGCLAAFDPQGELLRVVDVPARGVTSVCFGVSEQTVYATTEDHEDDPRLRGCLLVASIDVLGAAIPVVTI
ncbi:SMP-30/gluconolactonase/LRE family protein [Trebonia sp.]|uniref:SMP-30/gluconolactonase/LRE family protein n=1 Tax=Trebonia sp. TaxID=2767075 RepID=UPI00262E8252|nr:SMP-30/gluconolactonase/LRE family protein [Trebonia sp.]